MDRGRRTPIAAEAPPTVSVREEQPANRPMVNEQFNLTIDARGLRSDWRSPEDSGSLRVDVNDNSIQMRARNTGTTNPVGGRRAPCPHCGCDREHE
jgi:hypothetical protein